MFSGYSLYRWWIWGKTSKDMIHNIIKYGLIFLLFLAIGLLMLEKVLLPLYVGINDEHYLLDLRGKYKEMAKKELNNLGFNVENITVGYLEDQIPGTVVNISPRPFTKVKEGRTIKLTIAGDRDDVIIPDFTGITLRNVLLELDRMGLVQDTIIQEFNTNFNKGYVTYQSPRPGQLVKIGADMTLMVSRGDPPDYFRVPDLVNMSLSKAKRLLTDAGLKVGDLDYEYQSNLIPNTVIEQSMTAGIRLSIPARIDLIVSQDTKLEY